MFEKIVSCKLNNGFFLGGVGGYLLLKMNAIHFCKEGILDYMPYPLFLMKAIVEIFPSLERHRSLLDEST
jgi:hypothetical protein